MTTPANENSEHDSEGFDFWEEVARLPINWTQLLMQRILLAILRGEIVPGEVYSAERWRLLVMREHHVHGALALLEFGGWVEVVDAGRFKVAATVPLAGTFPEGLRITVPLDKRLAN